VATIEAQAERLGRLEERLAAAREAVTRLEAPPVEAPETERAPSPGGEARRWWQRLLWGSGRSGGAGGLGGWGTSGIAPRSFRTEYPTAERGAGFGAVARRAPRR
jgi:hypothetical protein